MSETEAENRPDGPVASSNTGFSRRAASTTGPTRERREGATPVDLPAATCCCTAVIDLIEWGEEGYWKGHR